MNARFEVAVGDSIAVVKILHGREKLNIFVNDVEQKATESTCEFQNFPWFFGWLNLVA